MALSLLEAAAPDLASHLATYLATYLAFLKHLVPLVAAGIALSCMGDLVMDALYGLQWLSSRRQRRGPALTAQQMARKPADWIAIFVPAREEANVIGKMLRNTLAELDYPRYRIFVGTYPDDPATQAAVRAVAKTDSRVLHIVADHSKENSSKAANLNGMYRAMLDVEARGHPPFKAVVLHDAEDMAHPLELHVFNWHIPAKALVQLPVQPRPHENAPWWAHTYLEEFAVAHSRDMVVRNWLGASLPSAGVGCAFSRPALEAAIRQNGGAPFRTLSKTEDYELGISLGLQGFPALMAHVPASPLDPASIATTSLFPKTFRAAARQRSRWLLGITLGGWRRFGWPHRLADCYMLLRDRKALPCALLNLAALFLFPQLVVFTLLRQTPALADCPPLIEPGSYTAHLLWFNMAALAWHSLRRMLITARIYGWKEGALSIPRSAYGILIHADAARLALYDDLREIITGIPAPWRKTMHHYPDEPSTGRMPPAQGAGAQPC